MKQYGYYALLFLFPCSIFAESILRKNNARASIVASMATIPSRESTLHKIVGSILSQVDRLNIFLNGHKQIPPFLKHPKIRIAHSDTYGDQGDIGKFFWADEIQGYHFTIDDDIIYPKDYVKRCIEKIEKYGRKAVVGIQGVLLVEPINNYYKNRKVFYFGSALQKDRYVHILGTGTVAYHTDTIRVQHKDFKIKNMADIWFGVIAQQQKVPMICIARPHHYLREEGGREQHSIYSSSQNSAEYQTFVVNQQAPWTVYEVK
jgi:hypothetical protein